MRTWSRATVTLDVAYKGVFQQEWVISCEYNYMNGGLLSYAHKCMRGKGKVVSEALFEGTSRSMEGIMSDEYYKSKKKEGCNVEVVCIDRASSAAKSVKNHHQESKLYK